ncbi:MAG: hypothetical protein ACJA0N_000132 [Pseudohongiellaceae bacterium]|jgi:hypothetical protein
MMKSQDILILLKLISLHQSESVLTEEFSVRALAASTGISKTEVSASLNRSIEAGLAKLDRRTQLPTANSKALLSFIVSGLRYVFPVKPGAIERGLITGFEAPGLEGLLSSVADYHYIWPEAKGSDKGQTVTPLYKTAPHAARQDPHLYQSMALVDAIRLGAPREVTIAKHALSEHLRP